MQDIDYDEFREEFGVFLAEHGCRGANEWETACPTWGTDPQLALVLVDRMRGAAPDHVPRARRAMLSADRAAALPTADTQLSGRKARRLRKLFACAVLHSQGLGDVLIAHLTDPAWTPLFVPVEAVVVDVGAFLSHAVIVARELGIPAVVSATDSSRRIPDGALIEVDGSRGTVTMLAFP